VARSRLRTVMLTNGLRPDDPFPRSSAPQRLLQFSDCALQR
jgi:hypothetical protein